jgi:Dolichyl-phosphate-mannose-protein mannosyltransferase
MSSALEYKPTIELDWPPRPPAPVAAEPTASLLESFRTWLGRVAVHSATWMVLIGVAALVARLTALRSAYDIFIDETSYTNIALNVAHGHGVTLYGLPFVLHPPTGFYLYGLTILLFGLHGGTESTLLALRQLDAVLGATTCVITFLLVDRMARRQAAILAGLLVAIDPLAVSFDSRVMLEAPTQLAVVTMFFCMVAADAVDHPSFKRRNLVALAGLAGGVAISTKETFGLVVLLALVLMLLGGWVITRPEILRVAGIALVVYTVSIFADASHFGIGVWWNGKVIGILRLVGAVQNSGFNSPQTHVSILSRMVADMSQFGVTYLLLGAGAFCALGLVWRLEPWYPKRLVGDPKRRASVMGSMWTLSAAAYLAYATLFGTIEEQMYYILLLPCVVSVVVWVDGRMAARTVRWKWVAILAVGAVFLFDVGTWTSIHAGHDDEYVQLVSWETQHVAPSAVVSTTDGTSQFLLTRGVIGQWATVAQLRAHHVDYVVLSTLLVAQGYGIAGPNFERAVQQGGRLVFSANGPSDGSLEVFDVRAMTGATR